MRDFLIQGPIPWHILTPAQMATLLREPHMWTADRWLRLFSAHSMIFPTSLRWVRIGCLPPEYLASGVRTWAFYHGHPHWDDVCSLHTHLTYAIPGIWLGIQNVPVCPERTGKRISPLICMALQSLSNSELQGPTSTVERAIALADNFPC